ncbi:MAG TPA: heparinase II/III family protein [Candidatus Sulfotelmatobacter sp.]|nr:heparinase II/III family protein [Candidatus Sulfotelmatobacter sp.]
MKRRDFMAGMGASVLLALSRSNSQVPVQRPRMLISVTDAFTGIDLLRTRQARGMRPSEDMEGWALSWQLTRQDTFAEKALTEMRKAHVAKGGKASRSWLDYARWSLAFDWLSEYPGFEPALQKRIADELMEGASAMLATPDFADPGNYSYHNYAVRYLCLPSFVSAALDGYAGCDNRCNSWRAQVAKCLTNVLETTNFVSPEGSYHESMDYMRITWASLTLLAELQRTTTGVDPAHHYSVFRNIGNTYLYKLLPDGTPSREGDNEYPVLDSRDTSVLGYAINRFKDPYSAWLLRESGFFPKQWTLPVLEFLWDDPEVMPRDPSLASESELPRQRYFPGVGHLVMRDGWKPDSTWIEFDCGPYLAKHQHLSQNQITIYHGGYLAIDSGADYTDTESPHYLNYYRRTVAHNSVLVYDPAEKFFWSQNLLPAANDGGQRMDSSRFWNTIRSPEDFERTRDLWNLASMRMVDYAPGQYQYAMGDATNAYSREKLRRFTRELLYVPGLLFVFDRVVSPRASFRKAWLLHGVNQPSVDQDPGNGTPEAKDVKNGSTFRFREGSGELLVHSLLPRERVVTRRGGPGYDFYTPGDDHGGPWGSGENWPLDPPEGGPLPNDPKLHHMWKMFWGDDFSKLLPSNRKNVVPGAWRIEVSPALPAEEDFFLHVFEIGNVGTTGRKRTELIDGVNFLGAASESGPLVLFSASDSAAEAGEATLPDLNCASLIASGLSPDTVYELSFTGPNVSSSPAATLPGVQADMVRLRSNGHGVLLLEKSNLRNLRLRIARV